MPRLSHKSSATPSGAAILPAQNIFHLIENLAFLKKYQRTLHDLTGLPFDFVDTRNRSSSTLLAQNTFTDFCSLVRRTPASMAACECADRKVLDSCARGKQGIARPCHLGLIDITVPVVLNGEVVGYLCTGQFLGVPPSHHKFRRIQRRLRTLGVDILRARRAYFEIPVFRGKRVKAILDLMGMVTGLIDINRLPLLTSGIAHHPLNKALNYIEQNYQNQLSLPLLARVCGLSASRLAHVFRSQLNTSFIEYLNRTRIDAAKNQLADTPARISEIAFETGFGNLSHFNHVFRQITGLSPTQYRRQHKSTNFRQSAGGNSPASRYTGRNKKEKELINALKGKRDKSVSPCAGRTS